jgi:hypothetical protein
LVQAKEESEAFVVRVDVGSSESKIRRFRTGNPVATLTVGSQGAWKVEAPGVASVHAYLRFDGRQLLVATSDPRRPVVIDGRPAPETWSPLHPPCLLSLGHASLSVERDVGQAVTPPNPVLAASPHSSGDEDEPTRAIPMPAAGWQVEAEHDEASAAELPSAEPTRLQFGPLEPPEPAGTRALQVSSLPPTFLDPPSLAVDGALGTRGSTPTPTHEPDRALRQRWLRRGGLVLGGVVAVSGIYWMASQGRAALADPSGSPAAEGPPNVASIVPPASAPLAVQAAPVVAPPSFVSPPEPEPTGSATGARTTTLERRAADALAAGDFPTALRFYRELAVARPDVPAFRQAVRILEQK